MSSADSPPPRAAFFDVDNTIIRGASIFQMARGLYQRRFITWRDILGFAWQQANFLLVGENLDHVADIETKALSFVAGHHVTELRAIGEEIYDELMADKVWPGPYALARAHMDAGDQVWLVTATPVEVAEVIAARLGLTGALGTVAEHSDGVYTGRLVGGILHGEAKAAAVRELAARQGLDLAVLLGLQRLGERPTAARHGRHAGGGQPRPRSARSRQGQRLAGPRLSHRSEGGPDSGAGGCPRRSRSRCRDGRGGGTEAALELAGHRARYVPFGVGVAGLW